MGVDRVRLLVLNYNGRALLEECLPSIVEAARRSRRACEVSIIDNDSSDDSPRFLESAYPNITVIPRPNRGLASFNDVLPDLSEPVVFLLNNDVKLEPDAIDPLVDELETRPDALFSAPKCLTFERDAYEGMRTRVRSRFGIVQGLCRVPGHERFIDEPDLTAASGPILAVDREAYLKVGGFDPVFFPGRIEDLDLGFRAWMAGYRGYYNPESLAYHRGFGSFGPKFGRAGCDRLALRNTLIFSWRNLCGGRLLAHFAWLPIRLAHSLVFRGGVLFLALGEALASLPDVLRYRKKNRVGQGDWTFRQERFFETFRF